MIHCETTTGILNSVDEVAQIVKGAGRRIILDAMSSFGAIPIDIAGNDLDFVITSPNKCLESVPGFSIVIARRQALLDAEGAARSVSLDLLAQLRSFEANGQFRFTPPTHGASLDAISVGGEAIFRSEIGPLLPGTQQVPPPDPRHCPFGCGNQCNLKCADYIEYVLEKEGDVGAVIAETVRSTPFIPSPEYWKRVRAA